MSDTLADIPSKYWTELRDLYKADWPLNLISYYTIDNIIRWLNDDSPVNHLRVCCLNGDWSDGTFAIIHRHHLYWNSLSRSNDRLIRLLLQLDWNYGFKISPVLPQHRNAFQQVIETKRVRLESNWKTSVYLMTSQEAANLSIELPDGIFLRNLQPEHAEFIDSIWTSRHIGSKCVLELMIRHNPNVGAFNSDGDLLAWSMVLPGGSLGALQVDFKYLKKGQGSLVCKALTKQLGDYGRDIVACVSTDNQPANVLFKSFQFKEIGTAYFPRTLPFKPDFEWHDKTVQ